MELINPGIGLVFWLTVTFLILLFLLKKFAWLPILGAVNQRNAAIDKAMLSAEEARAEVAQMKADNERIIKEAKLEKEQILKEARAISLKIIAEAKDDAMHEAQKIVEEAQKKIDLERQLAVKDIKSQVASHAVSIAERILRDHMTIPVRQEQYLNNLVEGININ